MTEPQHTRTRPPALTPAQQIALIRSLTGHSQGREDLVLRQVQAVLHGADIGELVAMATACHTDPLPPEHNCPECGAYNPERAE